ncbi:MAG: hypothetical protein GF331_21485 [Chitinivibrionales bacterium]|nr:hypothetical protein [Chitinivibrionales bacterium]
MKSMTSILCSMGRRWRGVLSLCAVMGTAAQGMELLDGIAAVVGDEPILVSELEAYMLMRFNEMKMRPDTVDIGEMRRGFLNEIIEGKVLLAHARKDSMISVSPNEVEAALEDHIARILKSNQLTTEALERELAGQGMTMAKFRAQLRRSIEEQLLRRNVHQRYMMNVNVSRRDVEAFYEEYRDSLPTLGESYRLLKLSMAVPTPDSVREAAYERIKSALTRLENGESFEELAKQFSDGPNAALGGDLGFIAKGTLNELAFEEAAFSLEPGETSGIVETRLGFHILKLVEKKNQQVHIKQILINVSPPAEVEQHVLTRIDSIRTAVGSADDFKQAVQAFSADARSRSRGGDIGWHSRYRLPSSHAEAFDTLAVGAVSKPIHEDERMLVLYIADYAEDREVSLENDWDLLAEKTRDILAQKKMSELVERWREDLYIDIRIE